MSSTDVCRTFYSNAKLVIFFSAGHEIFFKTDNILGHKKILNNEITSVLVTYLLP